MVPSHATIPGLGRNERWAAETSSRPCKCPSLQGRGQLRQVRWRAPTHPSPSELLSVFGSLPFNLEWQIMAAMRTRHRRTLVVSTAMHEEADRRSRNGNALPPSHATLTGPPSSPLFMSLII